MNRVDTKPDIARAIRRSRSARAALSSRRRRRAAIVGALAIALAGAGTLSLDAMTGGDVVHAAVAQAQSLTDLLNGRSPGERTQAALTKTKRAARVLPKAHAAAQPVLPPTASMVEIAHLLAPPEPALVNAPPLAAVPFGPPPMLSDIIVPPGGGGGGGGVTPPGGGGGGVVVPNPPGGNPTPPPPPVPEPATWAMMLLGFGLVGWRVRSTKRRAAQALTA